MKKNKVIEFVRWQAEDEHKRLGIVLDKLADVLPDEVPEMDELEEQGSALLAEDTFRRGYPRWQSVLQAITGLAGTPIEKLGDGDKEPQS